MQTAKIIFNWLRKVSHLCSELKYGCENCPFRTKHYTCKIKNVTYELCRTPSEWDIDSIEKRWDQE